MFHHRRDVVGLIRLHRRELEVGPFGDRTGLGDFGGDSRDATDFVFGDNGAGRKTPDTAVHDAHTESARLTIRVGRDADSTRTAATTTTAATSTTAATKSATGPTGARGAEVGRAASSNVVPSARANARTRSIVVSPIPRAGTLMMRSQQRSVLGLVNMRT